MIIIILKSDEWLVVPDNTCAKRLYSASVLQLLFELSIFFLELKSF